MARFRDAHYFLERNAPMTVAVLEESAAQHLPGSNGLPGLGPRDFERHFGKGAFFVIVTLVFDRYGV